MHSNRGVMGGCKSTSELDLLALNRFESIWKCSYMWFYFIFHSKHMLLFMIWKQSQSHPQNWFFFYAELILMNIGISCNIIIYPFPNFSAGLAKPVERYSDITCRLKRLNSQGNAPFLFCLFVGCFCAFCESHILLRVTTKSKPRKTAPL